MKISELMTSPPVAVHPGASVQDIVRLLVQHRIGSVPVVDEDGRLLGLITETDLFPKWRGVPFSTLSAPSLFEDWVSLNSLPESYARWRGLRADDIMTRQVCAVDADADVSEGVQLMVETGRKHVPVLHRDRLVGIVTRQDLLRAFCLALHPQRSSTNVHECTAPRN